VEGTSTRDNVYLTDSFLHAMDVTTKGAARVFQLVDDSRNFTIFCTIFLREQFSQFYEPISEIVVS
jgi:hypothetical protein